MAFLLHLIKFEEHQQSSHVVQVQRGAGTSYLLLPTLKIEPRRTGIRFFFDFFLVSPKQKQTLVFLEFHVFEHMLNRNR
jgi:hypothetical protein